MELRLATTKDEPYVLEMAHKFYYESPYRGIPINEKKITDVVSNVMSSELCLVLLLVAAEDEPVGMIAGYQSEMIFSTDKMASEIIWWVDPAYRGTRHSLKLLHGFEYWAYQSGCKFVQMSALGNDTGSRVADVYKKRKYINTEQAFVKEF